MALPSASTDTGTPPPLRSRRRFAGSYWLDWLLLFIVFAALVWPLFKTKYFDAWASIESTFIADGRFLADNWVHPNWQPNWYCGTRTDYIYPPALRYGTAVMARYIPRMLPARAYHLYTGFFYCFGIAAVYLLVRQLSGSRPAGLLSAVAAGLVSPTYMLAPGIGADVPVWMPHRLNVLIRFGEGPHMTALAWIPLALLFSWLAIERWRPVALAAAAFCCAIVVSNNFYGATALAIFYAVLVWSIYITNLNRLVWVRSAAIPVLAYGLTAFWLVPSYVRLTLDNMRFVSQEGNQWSLWVALLFAVSFVLLSDQFARGRRDRAWITFLMGSAALFFLNVVGNQYLGFRVLGEPGRLFPELDLILILLFVELLRRLWNADLRWPVLRRSVAAVLFLAAIATSYRYLADPRSVFVRDPVPEDRVEYQLQQWMSNNMPGARAVTGGSVRFWYNVWHDLPMVGGGSEQGLLNPHVMPPQWEIFMGPEPEMSVLWMQILGVDAAIVNSRNSREIYHDWLYPDKFRNVLPVVHDNTLGDVIYGVPRRYRSLARVVDRVRFDGLPEIPGNGSIPELQAWHSVVENGPDAPTQTRWEGTDILHVKARVEPGQAVWVQASFDSNWRAYSRAQALPIRMDKLGFMLIEVPPGAHDIRMEFPTPFSNLVGRGVTLFSLASLAGLIVVGRRRQ